jgi:hypothetical protein
VAGVEDHALGVDPLAFKLRDEVP